MFGSSVLEVAIGIIFFYLLMSLVTTSLHETFSSLINKRGKNLFDGIKNLLNDPKFTGLAQQLYAHGLVDGISQNATNSEKPNRLPSYMGANIFSLALIDILAKSASRDLQQLHMPFFPYRILQYEVRVSQIYFADKSYVGAHQAHNDSEGINV